jgi:hypothetical protein
MEYPYTSFTAVNAVGEDFSVVVKFQSSAIGADEPAVIAAIGEILEGQPGIVSVTAITAEQITTPVYP